MLKKSMKILANDGISPSGKNALTAAGFEVITEKVAQENLAEEINKQGIVGVLVRSATTVRKEVIDACPDLKLIGRGGVGMDNIDVDYARSKGLEVINTPAASSQSVAELVFAHLFGAVRFIYDANRQMPSNGVNEFGALKKKYAKGLELRGKTIGIIGFGRIGQSVAQYALGIGMNVMYCDRSCTSADITVEIANAGGITVTLPVSDMDTLLTQSDFISIHVPKQADGSAVIAAKQFAMMKDGAVLINAARGGVINEADLITALDSGKVAHAGLDVYDNEPTPNGALLTHPKVSLTPHIGAATMEAQDRIGTELAEKIASYFAVTA
jgi:D-3-phosphoglycerate dehydrogenase